MKYIRPQEIIHCEEFLREPVQDTFKKIESIPTSKIILRGKGTGRSTLLNYMQEKKANTVQPFMYLDFSRNVIYSNPIDLFPKEFFEHYWERIFTRKILNYIEYYYEILYRNDFIKYSDLINVDKQKINDLLNCIADNVGNYLPKMYYSKEICGEVLDKFKKIMNIESIELGIDRFDSINNSDKLTQNILSAYFELFDKTIIVVDDENLPREWYKTYFNEESELFTFTPYSIEYNKNLEIIYNIIKKKIMEYNKLLLLNNNQNLKSVPLDWLNYDTLKLLVNSTNGNISLILDIVNELILLWEFDGYIIKENFEKTIQNKVKNELSKKLMFKQPKLYL